MSLLIFYLTIAVAASFLCSILEAVLLSITPSFVAIKLEEGKAYAKDLQGYKDNIDRPLAAILTFNTFAHTLGAAGVGAQAQLIWGNEYLTVVSVVMTLIVLIFSEIIPKTLGASYWRQLAGFTATNLKIMLLVLYPLVVVSQLITRMFKNTKNRSVLSRADFHMITEFGTKHGVFLKEESKIIQNLLRLDQVQVEDIMTPRVVVAVASEDMTISDFHKSGESRFSRIPVYRDRIDDITGYVLKAELLTSIINEQADQPLKSIKRKMMLVSEDLPITDLFQQFLRNHEHIAVVTDEFGGMSGIVTMEDVIETLLGMEIVDELDSEKDMRQLARKNWEKRARAEGLIKDEDE